MTKDEALRMALEALENLPALNWIPEKDMQVQKAITAIREVLAQPEQEPVATDWERIARVQNAKLMAMCDEAGGFEKLCEVMNKYERINPPHRKPLTDEEIKHAWYEACKTDVELTAQLVVCFARAIEAAHGITGEQHG